MISEKILNLRAYLAQHPEIYQFDLLKASEFSKYSKEKGLRLLGDTAIKDAWELGLLRADLIISPRKIQRVGFAYVCKNAEQQYVNVDDRKPRRRVKGWASSVNTNSRLSSDVELYFHPFRYYVLYHLQRVFELNIHPFQFLWSLERLPNVVDRVTNELAQWTGSTDFLPRILEWNEFAELAISVEPCAFMKVFNKVKWRHPDSRKTLQEKIDNYRKYASNALTDIGLDNIERIRGELCVDAEILDGNKVVHVLLRLMKAQARQNLKGDIGGSILVLAMAEIIRRTAEDIFDQQLREEDELGFGQWMKGARKTLYGSDRVLDAPRNVANELMRQYGLDYGVRVRCYVEGDTEYGALASVIAKSNGVELINLSGNVIEKRKKGVAFRDSLKTDKDSRIFSIVILDGDREDFVRAVRTAAAQDEMCGLFFISDPDFELHNYTIAELGEILWNIAAENGAKELEKPEVLNAIQNARSGDELMKSAHNALPELARLSKSADWGERLMSYALKHPVWMPDDSQKEQERPIIEITNTVLRGVSANYVASCVEMKTDPNTGSLIRRES